MGQKNNSIDANFARDKFAGEYDIYIPPPPPPPLDPQPTLKSVTNPIYAIFAMTRRFREFYFFTLGSEASFFPGEFRLQLGEPSSHQISFQLFSAEKKKRMVGMNKRESVEDSVELERYMTRAWLNKDVLLTYISELERYITRAWLNTDVLLTYISGESIAEKFKYSIHTKAVFLFSLLSNSFTKQQKSVIFSRLCNHHY